MEKLRNKKRHKTYRGNNKEMAEVLLISNYIKCKCVKLCPIKRQRLAEMIFFLNMTQIYPTYKTSFRFKDTNRLIVKRWEKIFHSQ